MKMKSQSIRAKRKITLAEHILSSLAYLYLNCPVNDIKPIIKTALDLCYSSIRVESKGLTALVLTEGEIDSKNFLSSLEYLKNEASRHKFEDVEMIIDATLRLCFAMKYFQTRSEYCPFVSSIQGGTKH